MTPGYLPVYICPITCWFSKYSKTWYITVILKNEKIKEPQREREPPVLS